MKSGFDRISACFLLVLASFSYPSFAQTDTLWYAHKAFGEGRYDDAMDAYQAAIDEGSSWTWLPDLIETVQIRKNLGDIIPADTHKIKVIFVVELNEINNTDTTTTIDTTPQQKATWKIYFDVFRETIESFSAGNWTIAFDSVDAISHYRTGSNLKPDNPDHLNLGNEFFDSMADFDSYITFSNTRSPAVGLARRYPYINGVLYGPHRGMDAINSGTHGYGILLHEFFHIVEWVSNLISPTHGFEAGVRSNFPGWTGDTEFDYYRWHFSETLGGKDWPRLNHRTRWIPLFKNEQALGEIRTTYKTISLTDRQRADTLFDDGNALKGTDITMAVNKWEEAIALSPYHLESLSELHDYYRITNPDQNQSEALYEKLKLAREISDFYTLDSVNIEYGGVVGMWHREDVSEQWQYFDWEFTHKVSESGCYDITFLYTNGFKALDIDSVSIVEDGVRVSLDAHVGFSGNVKTNITYSVKIPTYKSESNYLIRAKVKGNGGVDSYGQIHYKLTSDTCNGVQEDPPVVVGLDKSNPSEIAIYPNPTTNNVYIKGVTSGGITIYNAQGQVVLTKDISASNPKINLTLNKGYYIIHLENANGDVIRKRLLVR